MPVPLIAALAPVAGSLINSANQTSINAKNYRYAVQMYEKQKADNLAFWNMQNEYNSPQNQMRRFQEAGLNPNLIYGQGNAGNASPVQTPDLNPPQLRSPELGNTLGGLLTSISQIYDLDIKAAQADNLKTQNTVLEQDAILRGAMIGQTKALTDRTLFDLDFERDMRNWSADARREQVRALKIGTDLNLRKDVRDAMANSVSIQEALSRMETNTVQRENMMLQRAQTQAEVERIKADTKRIKQTIALMQKDNRIKALDAALADEGVRPGDPMWYRLGSHLMQSFLDWFND